MRKIKYIYLNNLKLVIQSKTECQFILKIFYTKKCTIDMTKMQAELSKEINNHHQYT